MSTLLDALEVLPSKVTTLSNAIDTRLNKNVFLILTQFYSPGVF